jgi:hypothetical protein
MGILLLLSLFQSNCSDISTKSEYAVLQQIEYNHRQINISDVQIKMIGNYTVAGFRADNGKNNVWILLNAKHAPYYKQIPQDRFSLTAVELERIRATGNVSSTVVAVLETRIREK